MSTVTAGKSPETLQYRPGLSGLAAGLAFIALIAGAVWFFFATHPRPVSTLKVAAPDQERIFSTISPYGPGLERELVEDFCRENGYQIEWIRTQSLEEGWEMLAEGKAHVFISTGYKPEEIPDALNIAAGPVYETHRPVLLGPPVRSGSRATDKVAGQTALDRNIPSLSRDLYRAAVRAELPRSVQNATQQGSTGQDEMFSDDEADDPSAVALVENGSYLPWRPFHHRIRQTRSLDELVGYRWFWRTDVPKLDERLQSFFRAIRDNGHLEDLQERYFGFFPSQGAYGQLWLLRNAVRNKLPQYSKYILDAAKRYQLDPLLLVAVIFQESAFDPDAVSYTGVKGLMQLTQQTASALGATDRTDPAQSIYFGAKYLNLLWKELDQPDLSLWDRWSFALAAYNQGIGHVSDAMFLAERLGKDPNRWRDVKQVLPLLADEQWHSGTTFGYSRGWEGVDYVDRVRFYYYVLKGLSFIPGLQLEQLAPLVPDFGRAGFRPLLRDVRLPPFPG